MASEVYKAGNGGGNSSNPQNAVRSGQRHYEEEDWRVINRATRNKLSNGNKLGADKIVHKSNKDYHYEVWERDADGNTVGKVTKAKTVDAAMANIAKRRGGNSAFRNGKR